MQTPLSNSRRLFANMWSDKGSYVPSHQQKTSQANATAKPETLTTNGGLPIGVAASSLTAGARGPILLQDMQFTEEMAHFSRERIPERVVHARGAGAFGYFEVTNDITQYCKAKMFDKIGKRTPIAVRFSTTAGEAGSADTLRDPRGFAVKFYTEQGNWDLVGNNTPIFFIRDPILFPLLSHAQKRNPQTFLKDPNAFWDFMTLRPESLHEVSMLFTERGIPDGFRHMNGFGNHAFKLVNASGKAVYCKFHYKSNQGIKHLTPEKATELAGSDPDYALGDLYKAIEKGDFPSWTLYIQVMSFREAEQLPYNPFDITKVWYQSDFPLIPVGTMVLNRNPVNYFAEVEQLGFQPRNLLPGIEPSPDKMLHGRLFAYPDAQRYRLGVNYAQIPVNCPHNTKVANYERDGHMAMGNNQGNKPNYYPNSVGGPEPDPQYRDNVFKVSGDVDRYEDKDDYMIQVRKFYMDVLKEEERQNLCKNIASNLGQANQTIQARAVKLFNNINFDYGTRLQDELDKLKALKEKKAEEQRSTETPKLRQYKLH
ncbi:catalase-like [Pelobates fuscus]|uniref:catalase-like n=1 Tax=Pelobates fuscus TaxID=191477 RepID=UPI002FE47DD6